MSANEGIKIRPMLSEDIDAVFEIDKKITAMERALTYSDLVDSFIGGQIGCSFVAEQNGNVVGFILAAIDYAPDQVSEICIIQTIGVEPEHRHKGIATRLIRTLAELASSKGAKMMRVMIDQHDVELQALFESQGFRRGRLIDFTKTL